MRKELPALLYAVLVGAAILRLWILFEPHVLYWDGAVYTGMAKYIYSWGQIGLWEPIRPLLWPLILGIPWFLGLDTIITGHIFQLLFSLGIIWFVYRIAEHFAGRRAGVIAASTIAFSSVFLFLNYRLLTEIPAAFFAVLAIYLYLKERPLLAGLAAGAAFLTKFPFGLFLLVVILADLNRVKVWLRYLAGFAIPALGYLVLNFWWYGNALYPLMEANRVIKLHVACNITSAQPWFIYIVQLPFDNIFLLAGIIGLVLALLDWDLKGRLMLFSVFIPAAYLFQLSCRDFRFAMMFIPFLAVLAGFGIVRLLKEPFFRWPQLYPMVIVLILGVSTTMAVLNYNVMEPAPWPDEVIDYYTTDTSGTVIAASPWPAAYADVRVRTLYYPSFDTATAEYYEGYFLSGAPDYVFMDECGGGIECPPSDLLCPAAREEMIAALREYREVVSFERNQCMYGLYSNS